MFEPPQARSISATGEALTAGGRDARAPQAGTASPAAVDATTSPDAAQDVPADDVDDRGGEYQPVSFAKLAGFAYDQYAVEESLAQRGDGTVEDQIPAAIRALDGRKVAVRGFMVPIEFTRNETRSFLLVRNRMVCCFGMLVGLNEWIYVRMKEGRTARWLNDIPVTVYGTLAVGEDIRDGMVLSIYRMEGEEVLHQGGY
jgi:hypothetical protein